MKRIVRISLIVVTMAAAMLLAGCLPKGPAPTASVSIATTAPTASPAVEVVVEVTPTPIPAVATETPMPSAPAATQTQMPTMTPAPTQTATLAPTPAPAATQTQMPTMTPAPTQTATLAPTPAPANTPIPAPSVATCTLPANEESMPNWLAQKFGGTAAQWHRVIDGNTGLPLCAWEFTSSARELGVGENATLLYHEGASGTIHYGIRNSAGNGWTAAYLTGLGDFTVAQVGKGSSVAIDTATWTPGAASPEQIAARTPGGSASTATPAPAPRPTSASTINEAQLETLTGGPAQFWAWVKGDPGHWEFNSGEALYALTLTNDLPASAYISYGKETSPGSGTWEEARITRQGEKTPPLNKASFVTP